MVELSSCETQYVAASDAACHGIWLKALMNELKMEQSQVLKLMIDNKFVINLIKHPVSHGRSKHTETKYHFIREQVSNETLGIEYCRSEVQLADILKKGLEG